MEHQEGPTEATAPERGKLRKLTGWTHSLAENWRARRDYRREFEMKHGWRPQPSQANSTAMIASITALISVILICATAIIIAVLVTFPKEVYDVAWTWGTR